MIDPSPGIPKCQYRPIHFLAEAMLAQLVSVVEAVLWSASLAAAPWVALELAGCNGGWTTLAGTLTVGVIASIPVVFGLRRIGCLAARDYRDYRAYSGWKAGPAT